MLIYFGYMNALQLFQSTPAYETLLNIPGFECIHKKHRQKEHRQYYQERNTFPKWIYFFEILRMFLISTVLPHSENKQTNKIKNQGRQIPCQWSSGHHVTTKEFAWGSEKTS